MAITKNSRFAIPDDVAYIESSPERVVVYKFDQQIPIVLLDTAAYIWNLIEESESLAKTIRTLSQKFNIDEAEISEQVIVFVEGLYKQGYLLKK
ncbi:MAG: PqqD family protein [Micrococcaceae bacterium]